MPPHIAIQTMTNGFWMLVWKIETVGCGFTHTDYSFRVTDDIVQPANILQRVTSTPIRGYNQKLRKKAEC